MRFSTFCTPNDNSDKTHWCLLRYCCACLNPNTILMETGWTTVPCPATNLSILTCKSPTRTKQSVISVALKTHLEIKLGICMLKTLLLHRPNDYIGFTPSCPPTFYKKIALMHERAGWGHQNWLCAWAWETLGTPLVKRVRPGCVRTPSVRGWSQNLDGTNLGSCWCLQHASVSARELSLPCAW